MADTIENNTREATVSIWPTVWKYSLIATACTFVYTVILYTTGLAGNSLLGLVATVIFTILLVIALKKYRSLNGGFMTYGKAAVIGIMIGIIESVLRATLNATYLAFIDKSVLPDLLDKTMQQVENAPGVNQQTLDMMTKIYGTLFTPGGIFASGCIFGIIGGIIIALIVAAILKKDPPITA